jgi:hypothetical protein
MRSLVRFAWAELSAFETPVEALGAAFRGTVVRFGRGIAKSFSSEVAAWYVDDPVIGGHDVTTMEPLLRLQQELRADLEAIGNACLVWKIDTTFDPSRTRQQRFFPKGFPAHYFVE